MELPQVEAVKPALAARLATGWVMVTEDVAEQAVASVMVTVYVPAGRLAGLVVAPAAEPVHE